jgi:hypothetical protein
MEYQILRLIFINPVALPVMTESYLRKDFHFALYLGYCYGKVLTNFFRWSLWGLLVALFIVIILNITIEAVPNEDVRLYFNLSLLIVSFICMLLLKSCLTSAEKKLTPSVFDDKTGKLRDPDRFNVCFSQKKGYVDPFVQYDELPRMPYLDFDEDLSELNTAEKEQLIDDEERQALLDISLASER